MLAIYGSTAAALGFQAVGEGIAYAYGAFKAIVATLVANELADGDADEVRLVETGLDAFERAKEFGIRTYNQLRGAIKGTGLQAHHIVEKRFAENLGIKPGQIPSIALTPEEHQLFTNAWRDAIGYAKSGNELNTLTATAEQIWAAAQGIYAQYPELLEAARQTIFDLPGR